jgi:predicted DNA-binding transcriptional regulator YafY
MRGVGTRDPRKTPATKMKRDRKPPAALPGREDRSKRLLDLVVLLLGARQPVPYREIRGQFRAYQTTQEEAGLRAFERDKADLVELGVPLRYVTPDEDETIEEGGYVVDLRRYRLPELRLTPDEVAALVLAGAVAHAAPGTTYDEVVALALKKLAFDQPRPDTPRDLRTGVGSGPVLVHFPHPAEQAALDERLALLEQATANRKRLTLRYVNASTGEVLSRQVDPYGLVYRQGAWLLVGHCHLRAGVRSFRIDRIATLEVAPKPRTPDFERPAAFDVRRYAARSPWTFEIEPPVEVVLLVKPEAGAVANEELGDGARRDPRPDGSVLVTMPCSNPEYLVLRVLAAKGALVVLEPESVRARVRGELERVQARYEAAR